MRFVYVKKAQYVDEYKILLTFNDKKKKVVDFREILNDFKGPIFQPLKDVEYFKSFKVAIGTVTWPNEADVSPDYLYEKGLDVNDR